MTPRYAPQFGSRLHFKRCQPLPKETPFNTSFTDLSDSRVKTEIAKADVAELQLFDSVEAKQYKRPDMNGDLRLGFALDDFQERSGRI